MVATATLCLNSKKTERVMTMRNIWKGALGVLLALWATSCTNEWEEQQSGLLLKEGEVALQWLPANMGVHKVKTRGTDPKTADEQKISNVHIFIFDADGNYLTPDGADAIQFYRFVPTGQNTVLNTTLFGDQAAAESATVVVLANMPKDTFKDENNDGHPDGIESYDDFKDFVYNLPAFTTALPDEGLPMYGVKTGVNLSSNAPASEKVVLVQLKSLMSRIDLDFTMDPYPTPETGSPYPTLRFDEVYVNHFPNGGTLFPQLNDETVTETETEDKNGAIELLSEETQVTEGLENFTGRVMNANGSLTLSLYMFEHARLAEDFDYPDGIESEEYGYQRYKNQRAKDDAAYIKLTGVYTNHNGYKYKIVYTIYPGGNATDDFTIKANRQYKHNISVRGITANNHGEEALLDTRVDIDTEDNPYFIEMLREREHDAHFNVTPMDVYIYAGGTVTVEILPGGDGQIPDWIRMEPIHRAATQAGDGKREYFTENLVSETLADNTSYVVDSRQSEGADYTPYEERIYFYIDENVPTEQQANRDEDVPGRDATIKITWKRGDLEYSREAPIHQAGMRAVPVDAKEDNWGNVIVHYTIYMEEYEEYLEHYDGKDRFTHTYDGLEWGFMGIMTGLGSTNGLEFMPYGWRNTMTIMQKFRGQNPGDKWEMTLNEKPRGATEYCYNKNKRNPQTNRVDKCNWFHPTIRELEHMLDRYYGNYEVFQNRWYWSSNPGSWGANNGLSDSGNITWTGEHQNYARATKANYQGTNPDGSEKFGHATSEANKPYAKLPNGDWDTPYDPDEWGRSYPAIGVTQEGEGGYAKRDKVFRIRAAYIPDSEIGVDDEPVDNTKYYSN